MINVEWIKNVTIEKITMKLVCGLNVQYAKISSIMFNFRVYNKMVFEKMVIYENKQMEKKLAHFLCKTAMSNNQSIISVMPLEMAMDIIKIGPRNETALRQIVGPLKWLKSFVKIFLESTK